jgi:hypothetical protein
MLRATFLACKFDELSLVEGLEILHPSQLIHSEAAIKSGDGIVYQHKCSAKEEASFKVVSRQVLFSELSR